MDGLLPVLSHLSRRERRSQAPTFGWPTVTGLEQHKAIRRWPDTGSLLNTLPKPLTHRPR
jgi:hypothetical protein